MLPTGIITLWYGSIINIPAGWLLCDGNNGTPDLRNKFVVGAGNTYAVGATGGNLVHDHGFSGDGHTHDHPIGAGLASGEAYSLTTASNAAVGFTEESSSLPPYHSLCYIMKT